MKNKLETSEALKRVWHWKESIHKEVKGQNIEKQLMAIHEMAKKYLKSNNIIINSESKHGS